MSSITIQLEAKAMVPILQVFVKYFNDKYPCTDETNDGSDMPLEDEIKFATYNHLLNSYNKNKTIYDNEYDEMKEKLKP